MNKPIKFRAWDKDNEEMRSVYELNVLKNGVSVRCWGNPKTLKNIELMQFTGLLDKNGSEIYEGDLLRIDMEKFGVSDAVYKVIWEDDGWALKDLSDDTLPAYIFHDKDRQEVIGNVYENPELLA
jgi:uncharacterized phage protein (TIGR01671 family)